MISAPVLLIVAPLAVAAAVYPIRRFTAVASLLSTATALGMAWLASAIPETAGEAILAGRVTGGAQTILGRTLAASPADRLVLMCLSLAAAVLFLLAARLHPGGIFFPGLLALLGISAAVLVSETFVFSVLLLELTAGAAAILLQGARFGSIRGPWRFFVLQTLAVPLLLVAGWQIDFQAANPGQTGLLGPAVMFLTAGFAIYLAAVPFHLWIAPTAGEAQPLSQVVVFGLLQMVALGVIAEALESFSWFAESPTPYQWFTLAGSLTTGLGAALMLGADSFGQLTGCSLMVDMGALLMLLGTKSRDGLQAAWLLLMLRMASLVVWGYGLSVTRKSTGSDQIERAGGLVGRSRLATLALILGGFSLAGLPLTPGFPARWFAVELIARDSVGRAALLLLGTASGVLAMARMTRGLLGPGTGPRQGPAVRWPEWLKETPLALVLLGAIALALYPRPIFSVAAQIMAHLSYLR